MHLGQVTEFINASRAPIFGRSGLKPTRSVNFATITEEEYRERLKLAGVSEPFIERELELLRAYKARMDTENVKEARRRKDEKRTAEAKKTLGQYFEAGDRIKNRARRQQEQDDNGP